MDFNSLNKLLSAQKDDELQTSIEQADETIFLQTCAALLDLGLINEFYGTTMPGQYPFGPGNHNSGYIPSVDVKKLEQIVRKKWEEIYTN